MKPLTTGSYNNITKFDNCYGCGVCAVVCHAKIINIRLNEDGFYKPYIDDICDCTNCGLCLEVCAFNHQELAQETEPIACYAAWSKDPAIRYKCSSGGVGFEVGRALINKGYKVCGVRYALESQRAEHYIASNIAELIPSIGSKYIPSYTVDGFKAIDRKCKYLVTGCPCQIDSFRRYIRKFKCEANFVLLDFFCHGVPSMLTWHKYINEVENTTGKVESVSWRNKTTGWHDSWNMHIIGKDKTIESKWSGGDIFYNLFLGNSCLGKACYDNCKYKHQRSSADIRIGDMWGQTYASDESGVSAIITYTESGDNALRHSNCTIMPHPLEVVAESQMRSPARRPASHDMVMRRLKTDDTLMSIYHDARLIDLLLTKIPNKIAYYSKRIIQKLGLLK